MHHAHLMFKSFETFLSPKSKGRLKYGLLRGFATLARFLKTSPMRELT